MTVYYVDWSLSTGGEFYVNAATDDEAQAIIQEVINIELDRQMLVVRVRDVGVSCVDDEEEGDIDGPLYERDNEGRLVKVERRR